MFLLCDEVSDLTSWSNQQKLKRENGRIFVDIERLNDWTPHTTQQFLCVTKERIHFQTFIDDRQSAKALYLSRGFQSTEEKISVVLSSITQKQRIRCDMLVDDASRRQTDIRNLAKRR